jgi:hypothetical protein
MGVNLISGCRRDLNTMVARVQGGHLDASTFLFLAKEIGMRLDELERRLEETDAIDEVAFQARGGALSLLPLCRVRFHGHLAVIDGGRA